MPLYRSPTCNSLLRRRRWSWFSSRALITCSRRRRAPQQGAGIPEPTLGDAQAAHQTLGDCPSLTQSQLTELGSVLVAPSNCPHPDLLRGLLSLSSQRYCGRVGAAGGLTPSGVSNPYETCKSQAVQDLAPSSCCACRITAYFSLQIGSTCKPVHILLYSQSRLALQVQGYAEPSLVVTCIPAPP